MTLDLTIVTTVAGNYGQYLEAWARSIVGLERRPTAVAIVDNATDAAGEAAIAAAAGALEGAGLPVTVRRLAPAVDLGSARNVAVSLAATEWVMHFDADDELMPHALDEVAGLAPHADVVCLGYVRSGDLKAGPPNRTKLYRDTRGPSTLASPAPASGVSAFRRSLWERTPYRTDQIGGWDTALWLGFAHLGARFLATRRTCFYYRQHADSLFNTRVRSGWPAHRTGRQLQARRRGDAGVAVLIPWAEDSATDRQAALAWVQRRLAALYPSWDVRVGALEGGAQWEKRLALEAAAADCRAEVLVILDGDVALPPAALEDAVGLVRTGAPWVVPHQEVHRLDRRSTIAVLGRSPAAPMLGGTLHRAPYRGYAGGGALVVNRALWEAVGGIPAGFAGWGAEDEAVALVLDTLLGPHVRLGYPCWHLWHEPATRARGHINRRVYQRLKLAAAQDPELLWATLRGTTPPPNLQARVRAAPGKRRRPGARPIEKPRPKPEEGNVAGALELRKLHAQRRREQKERNRQANEEAERRRREEATRVVTAENDPVRRDRERRLRASGRKLDAGPGEDKRGPGPGANKGGSGVLIGDGVTTPTFASRRAQQLAAEARLRPSAFRGKKASSAQGFTADDVRAIAAGK